jgi:hypothetical protein
MRQNQSANRLHERSPLTDLSSIEADDVLGALHELEKEIEELNFEEDQLSRKKRDREYPRSDHDITPTRMQKKKG